MTKYFNTCKISITLPSCQLSKLATILEYNIINFPDLLSNKNEGDIGLGALNNNDKKIKLGLKNGTGNDNRDIA